MHYQIVLNIAGVDCHHRQAPTWGEAVAAASDLSGYSATQAQRYLTGAMASWDPHQDTARVMPTRDRLGAVWITPQVPA